MVKLQETDVYKKLPEFYIGSQNELRWYSNDAVVPHWVFTERGMVCPADHRAVYDEDTAKSIEEYKKRMENYVYSDEELFEMRAAFGEGAEVVNVITGKKIKL